MVLVAKPKKESSNSTPSSLRRFFCTLLFILQKKPSSRPDVEQPIVLPVTATRSSSSSSSSSSTSSRPCELGKVFDYFDENGDGKISPTELQKCMRTAGAELSAEDAEAAVESTDSDGDGLLGFEDFLKLVEVVDEEEKGRSLRDAFRVYVSTQGQEDFITPKSLRNALRQLGESKSLDECKVMIQSFDLNGDGVLSFDEFRLMML